MAPSTVGIILLIYRGHVRQFTTAADALQFVRSATITTTWFRKITADIHLVTNAEVYEAQYRRAHKSVILEALEQVDRETTQAHA